MAELYPYMLRRSKCGGARRWAAAVQGESMFVIYILSKNRSLKLDRET
jgi:hypothetical protein